MALGKMTRQNKIQMAFNKGYDAFASGAYLRGCPFKRSFLRKAFLRGVYVAASVRAKKGD